MRALFHLTAYHLARLVAKAIVGCVGRIRLLGWENANLRGGFLLAANHISHFDPPIIATVIPRKVDWMAMTEFFPHTVLGPILRAIDCLPTDRNRAERATIRGVIERLRAGRIVGLFPEGGIRDGPASVLEGAPLRPGVSALAQIAQVPILPCVILGTDRLYSKRSWRRFRKTPIWIGFAEMIPAGDREHTAQQLTDAFQSLYTQMRQRFDLAPDDLPRAPKARMDS